MKCLGNDRIAGSCGINRIAWKGFKLMQHGDLAEKVIGCAYKVYNSLGAGFLESVYETHCSSSFAK
ncbi:hypothetical protein HG15A2_42180 [Adhaeretor mobilis]|uniref:Uncharacterized protein n=1 Tax=Adhaeretor mobilis TaxID=1930276 RepID=A0A517N167_9BACT|nr:hypothetical protein HG15A2_42180 [Adhaeretor mobilis]